MKNISILLGLLLVVTSCADPDNLINDVLDNYTNGAVIRTISSSGEYNFYAPDTSVFTATIEEHDTENGDLMQDIEISVSFNSGTEKLIQTLLPSDFTTGPTGLPRTDISVSLGDAMTALGLSSSQYTGGDAVNINLKLNLKDGRSFGADQATGSMTGSYFKSPYRYAKIIKCIPLVAVPGIYTFNMADSYGDGWQGGGILVTVDGYATKYGIPDDGDTTGLETFTGNNSSGYSTLTIPIDASTMEFSWVNDTYNSECSFNVVYTELDGTNEQTALNVSVVSAGTKTLSICR